VVGKGAPGGASGPARSAHSARAALDARTTLAPDYEALCDRVAVATSDWIVRHPGSLVCFAAGDTPLPVYHRLVARQQQGKVDLSSVFYAGLDEWVGLGYPDRGSCLQVMSDAFYTPAGIPADRRRVFDGLADPASECRAMDQWIRTRGGIRFTLLGIGLNGHIGFNEPGAPDQDGCIVVDLDDTTRAVSVKYFGAERPVRQGVSVSARTLCRAESVYLMAAGANKAPIVARLLDGAPEREVPAARLLSHPGLRLFLDRDASGA
jgi:6-phosphogluconolactonase/glucosamine-6-phosphate isomerase/deaminase